MLFHIEKQAQLYHNPLHTKSQITIHSLYFTISPYFILFLQGEVLAMCQCIITLLKILRDYVAGSVHIKAYKYGTEYQNSYPKQR